MNVGKKGVILLAVLVGLSVVAFFPSEGMSLIITSECSVSASGPSSTGRATLADGSTFAGFVSGFGGSLSGSWTHQNPPCTASTGGSLPPCEICDEFAGASFAFCTAYCVAMDCDGVAPRATPIACQSILRNFQNLSCDVTFNVNPEENPLGDGILCFVNGGVYAQIWGPGTWNGEPGYTFNIWVHDNTPYYPDTYYIKVFDSSGTTVFVTSGDLTSGDIVIDRP